MIAEDVVEFALSTFTNILGAALDAVEELSISEVDEFSDWRRIMKHWQSLFLDGESNKNSIVVGCCSTTTLVDIFKHGIYECVYLVDPSINLSSD